MVKLFLLNLIVCLNGGSAGFENIGNADTNSRLLTLVISSMLFRCKDSRVCHFAVIYLAANFQFAATLQLLVLFIFLPQLVPLWLSQTLLIICRLSAFYHLSAFHHLSAFRHLSAFLYLSAACQLSAFLFIFQSFVPVFLGQAA